jgi:hypothetical protein
MRLMMKKYIALAVMILVPVSSEGATSFKNFDCIYGGAEAIGNVSTGNFNVSCGNENFRRITTGDFNKAWGNRLAATLTAGSNNLLIGDNGDVPAATTSNYFWLGVTAASPLITGNMVAGGTLKFSGETSLAADFSATSNTTLANITGLTATVEAGKKYRINAVIPFSGGAGGHKYALAGTATATTFTAQINSVCNSSSLFVLTARVAALAAAAGESSSTCAAGYTTVEGYIVVANAGTLTAQFAQNASNAATSTALAGAQMIVREVQ